MPTSPWTLSERRAKLARGPLAAQFDVDQPQLGLSSLAFSSQPIASAVLFKIGIEQQAERFGSGEVYVRGDDLIATYENTERRLIRVQVLWRALPVATPASAVGIELVVSVQTHLLDSDPELTIASSVPATDVRRLCDPNDSRFETVAVELSPGSCDISAPPGCFLFRLSPETTYLELVHPSDFRRVTISAQAAVAATAAKGYESQTRLFAERLEKGVILRSRVRGYFLAGDADEAAATRLYREFAASEPPLTA